MVRHGDRLSVGGKVGVTLNVHCHQGNNTCNGCEPGLVRAVAQSSAQAAKQHIVDPIQVCISIGIGR